MNEEVIRKLKTIKTSGTSGKIYNFEAGIILNLINKYKSKMTWNNLRNIGRLSCLKCKTVSNAIQLRKENIELRKRIKDEIERIERYTAEATKNIQYTETVATHRLVLNIGRKEVYEKITKELKEILRRN